jgi:hypothetical protein
MKSTTPDLDIPEQTSRHRQGLRSVKELLRLFYFERMAYLTVTLISVAVLLICAVILLFRGNAPASTIIGLFGSTGGITYSTGRLLRMWSDAIKLLEPELKQDKPE